MSALGSNAIENFCARSSHYTLPYNKTIPSLRSESFNGQFSLPCLNCACRYNLIEFFFKTFMLSGKHWYNIEHFKSIDLIT